jgi:hypothetical protein
LPNEASLYHNLKESINWELLKISKEPLFQSVEESRGHAIGNERRVTIETYYQ